MRQRHCGIDLNGRRDLSLRNWTRGADGEELAQDALIEGGIFGSIVRVGAGSGQRLVGGFQAELAPHGRGPGWGKLVGPIELRTPLRKILEKPAPERSLLIAAIEGLAQGASHAVLAIDDTEQATETRQENLLSAMHQAGLRHKMLVWRPVLTVLSFLKQQDIPEGSQIGVVNHTKDGFSVQFLRLRKEAGRTRNVLAPERQQAGITLECHAGYAGIEQRALEAVAQVQRDAAITDVPRSVGRLSMGVTASMEMLKSDRGRWFEFSPPEKITAPAFSVDETVKNRLQTCEVVLFESLVTGDIRRDIYSTWCQAVASNVIDMAETCVAEGALEAASRMSRSEPIYFDYLPQISTIVADSKDREPTNFDLIEDEATLAAGRIYRSPHPARLGLGTGQDRLTIYLKKELEQWPRRAELELGTTVNKDSPVDLLVEQSPLSGSARIFLSSPALARQHTVDWNSAHEIHKDWASLIRDLETPAPTIPNRLILRCGMEPWEDSNRSEGLFSLLERFDGQSDVDWSALANRLSSRPNGSYCVSSDGEIPSEIPEHSQKQFQRLTQQAAEEELSRLKKQEVTDNSRLRFLLWQFKRCPEPILDAIIPSILDPKAWESVFPLWQHRKMILQGLGRCAASTKIEKAILQAVFSRPEGQWKWWGENACVSFLISRSDEAVRSLNRKQIDTIGRAAIQDFKTNYQTDYTRFFYAPFLMVGALRWRQVERRSLVEGHDELADEFGASVRKVLPDVEDRSAARSNLRKYVGLLKQVLDELRGEGSNPELLLDLFGRDETPN